MCFSVYVHPKLSSYSRQKRLDVNGKKKVLVDPDDFFMFSIQDN